VRYHYGYLAAPMNFDQTIGNVRYTFIRGEGLSYSEATDQLMNCVVTARRRRLTGTALADAKNLPPEEGSLAGVQHLAGGQQP
jgi:hypothetical protein